MSDKIIVDWRKEGGWERAGGRKVGREKGGGPGGREGEGRKEGEEGREKVEMCVLVFMRT